MAQNKSVVVYEVNGPTEIRSAAGYKRQVLTGNIIINIELWNQYYISYVFFIFRRS